MGGLGAAGASGHYGGSVLESRRWRQAARAGAAFPCNSMYAGLCKVTLPGLAPARSFHASMQQPFPPGQGCHQLAARAHLLALRLQRRLRLLQRLCALLRAQLRRGLAALLLRLLLLACRLLLALCRLAAALLCRRRAAGEEPKSLRAGAATCVEQGVG